jgi:hypothetical protein
MRYLFVVYYAITYAALYMPNIWLWLSKKFIPHYILNTHTQNLGPAIAPPPPQFFFWIVPATTTTSKVARETLQWTF